MVKGAAARVKNKKVLASVFNHIYYGNYLTIWSAQMTVRVDLIISLDGFATTTDQTPDCPFGHDWPRLVGSYVATKTFQERVLHDTSGKGTTGLDDAYAKDYFDNIGAEIMGAGKFGLHNFPDDPEWKGWLG